MTRTVGIDLSLTGRNLTAAHPNLCRRGCLPPCLRGSDWSLASLEFRSGAKLLGPMQGNARYVDDPPFDYDERARPRPRDERPAFDDRRSYDLPPPSRNAPPPPRAAPSSSFDRSAPPLPPPPGYRAPPGQRAPSPPYAAGRAGDYGRPGPPLTSDRYYEDYAPYDSARSQPPLRDDFEPYRRGAFSPPFLVQTGNMLTFLYPLSLFPFLPPGVT